VYYRNMNRSLWALLWMIIVFHLSSPADVYASCKDHFHGTEEWLCLGLDAALENRECSLVKDDLGVLTCKVVRGFLENKDCKQLKRGLDDQDFRRLCLPMETAFRGPCDEYSALKNSETNTAQKDLLGSPLRLCRFAYTFIKGHLSKDSACFSQDPSFPVNVDFLTEVRDELQRSMQPEEKGIVPREVTFASLLDQKMMKKIVKKIQKMKKYKYPLENWSTKNVISLNGLGKVKLLNRLVDIEYAAKNGLIFDNMKPQFLPNGNFTFVVLENGQVSFGKSDNAWEFGTKHFQLARGREVALAGEIRIENGNAVSYNLVSGGFSPEVMSLNKFKDKDLKKVADSVFKDCFGLKKIKYMGEEELISKKPPNEKEFKKLCSSEYFKASNGEICQYYRY